MHVVLQQENEQGDYSENKWPELNLGSQRGRSCSEMWLLEEKAYTGFPPRD